MLNKLLLNRILFFVFGGLIGGIYVGLTTPDYESQLNASQEELKVTHDMFCSLQDVLIKGVDTCTSEQLHAVVQTELDEPICK